MLKFEEICELVRLVGTTGVARVEIENAGSRVSVDGRAPVQVITGGETGSVAYVSQPAEIPVEQATDGLATPDIALQDGVTVITSPIVGTFYRAPNPDAEPYVKVGDDVAEGQILCIVEAMKLMNEIPSDMDGKIVKIFPDNAEAVEYGQALFAIHQA